MSTTQARVLDKIVVPGEKGCIEDRLASSFHQRYLLNVNFDLQNNYNSVQLLTQVYNIAREYVDKYVSSRRTAL